MLTSRGRLAFALGLGMYVAAWALGTREAYAPAIGLAVLPAFMFVYVRLIRGPFVLARRGGPGEHVEGSELDVRVTVERGGGVPASAARLIDHLPGVGETVVPLRPRGDALVGRYVLRGLPRGRYRLDRARLIVEDPFGLARSTVDVAASGAIVVYPRIPELGGLFPDGAGPNGNAGRFLLSRGAGFDLHSVRDHQQGESLRRVHWPSTARRQKLMVKELMDAPRDEAAVVLDAIAGFDVGVAPDSSFETVVRAAGAILRRIVSDGRRSALIVNGSRLERTPVASLEGDWRVAMDLLAAVTPNGHRSLSASLGDGGHGLDAMRLFLVTSDITGRLAERLLTLPGGREAAVVWVDCRTWGTEQVSPGMPEGIALTLQRRGIPTVRIRRGDDLAAALSAMAPGTARTGPMRVGTMGTGPMTVGASP